MLRAAALLTVLSLTLNTCSASPAGQAKGSRKAKTAATAKAVPSAAKADSAETPVDSVAAPAISRLTEEDYREVAEKLGVETAAMKAVVDIEAGKTHEGFFAPGMPLINFDFSMFTRFAKRNGVNLAGYRKSHPLVFTSPQTRKYGSRQRAQHARLNAARAIDERTAIEGTFWGMFQIGGFNWRKCGASSITDFVDRMSRSERDQLELFAAFLKSTGLDKQLRAKNWAAFARGYNGPSYASRGYHTRMASAYARHKALEAKAASAK
ncbi:MAG: N-acetylmuramidase family protein [Candidatus Amulumruptor caecigallinarius]|nr:N-acetylmuramidase family protein [Candidatus Amulumruptor caecigallinarius]MCM1396149.1 N-acetylmuramidase family protein [Candidatus Amulumruptor caecigallinarius]MCM1453851.1 N-acetylmuramidase family protein [bacterium]